MRWFSICLFVGCLLLLLVGVGCAVQTEGGLVRLAVREEPLEIHHKDQGWAELPCLAITSDFAYVAYDVREGYESHVYLSRIARGDSQPSMERIRVDGDGEIEFAPSMSMDGSGGIWVAWSSFRQGKWAVRAAYVNDMEITSEVVISPPGGFNSQVRVESRDGATWFVWASWNDGVYRIMAATHGGSLTSPVAIYEGSNPVARPDLQVFGKDSVVFVWDEYVGGRYVIRMRERGEGQMGSVQDLCGEKSASSWEPHIAGAGENLLIAWHRVPGGSDRCQPAAALPGRMVIEEGIDRPEDRETWRVNCFEDEKGRTWMAWASRLWYRNTRLFLRRIDETGMSQTCKVEFPMLRNFINWLDCKYDNKLVLVWEYSGSILLSEFGLPRLETVDLASMESGIVSEVDGSSRPVPHGRLEYATVYGGDELHVYFGDYHNHTSFSDGRAYPDMSMILGRDFRALDFICITDHDVTLTPGEFAWNNAVADVLTEEGSYVCLHGFEPSKGWAQEGFGHWSLLLPGEGKVFQFEEGMTPRDLQAFVKGNDGILIPHHVAKKFAPYNWDYFDPDTQPVVEICSFHGIFESQRGNEGKPDMVQGRFVEDGLEHGYRFGFVGASDSHNCFEALSREYGLTGAYAKSLTSKSLFEAIKKRRTFAVTGSRVVVDFRCNGKFMGEEIEGADRLTFTGYVTSPDSIVSVEIVSGRQTIFEKATRLTEVSFEWETEPPDTQAYYYLRVLTARGDYAWSSPIWIVPTQ